MGSPCAARSLSKEPYNLVSDADVEAEQCIGEFIHRNFADHTVLGEEVYDDDGGGREHLWIVDPIDGTNNFAHRVPHFAVSVAYYCRGQPVCGVVANPVRDDWYEAARGEGAFHNGNRVHVGSQESLDQALVGAGSLGVFFEYQLSPWDFAAGRLFVEEAGGRVTTCRGEALPLEKTSLLASNSHLHDSALEIVQRHLPD